MPITRDIQLSALIDQLTWPLPRIHVTVRQLQSALYRRGRGIVPRWKTAMLSTENALDQVKRSVVATLQFAHLENFVQGEFADEITEGFFGWLSFRVIKTEGFLTLIKRIFNGTNMQSIDMVLRRCGFKIPPGQSFRHLYRGLGTAVWDEDHARQYTTSTCFG